MGSSRSFDRAADYYDRTRPFPEPAASLGVAAILKAAGPGARMLEVGAGTGRVSIPLLESGADLFGLDLSNKMLALLRSKHPSAGLVQADATHIPFPSSQFDALLTVHVMHLVSGWKGALQEFRRVLRPGGTYLNVRTYETGAQAVRRRSREFWSSWVAEHGYQAFHPGIRDHEELVDELRQIGAQVDEIEVTRYTYRYTPREELDRTGSRIYSDTWDVPEGIFAASLLELHDWMVEEIGDLDQVIEEEVSFNLEVARFGSD
jgi:ubiquinone/menaquinone biosynthesis C-methylase UbiE